MLFIDGSEGEGGGQILRTSLALSLLTQTDVMLTKVRAKRAKPGLQRQHLAAVRAAAAIGDAELSGAHVGSTTVVFKPRTIRGGDHLFSIGTAGSATLVLQTVMPALLAAKEPSRVVVEGGTHNPMAPPFDFLAEAFLPLVRRMGCDVSLALESRGFYPRGGGRIRAEIKPGTLTPLDLLERGEVRARRGKAIVDALPEHVATREIKTAAARLGWDPESFEAVVAPRAHGPGNALLLAIESEHVTEVFSAIGEKGVPAEKVALRAAEEAAAYLEAGVPVGEHLADQLVLLLALAKGGSFRTTAPSLHLRTHALLLEKLLGTRTRIEALDGGAYHVEIERG